MIKTIKQQIVTAVSLLACILAFSPVFSAQSDGLIRVESHHSVSMTIDRLQAALEKRGMTVFKRIDHAAGAEKVGIHIRPTQLLIFGNPKVGTRLMQCSQEAAIDLPQKALVYRDEAGHVWLTYNDPSYMSNRHHVVGCGAVIKKLSHALAHFATMATE